MEPYRQLRSLRAGAILLALCSSVAANSAAQTSAFRPLPSPALSRSAYGPSGAMPLVSAMPGADVIYNNSSYTGFYQPLQPGYTLTDDGLLPGPSHPPHLHASGCATSYLVTGLEIGYCTDMPSVDLELDFDSMRYICIPSGWPFDVDATVRLPGLPGSSTGSTECWIITVDLRHGGLNAPFTLLADGDGTWDPPPSTADDDKFNFRLRFTNLVGTNTGPIIAGYPSAGQLAGFRWALNGVDYSAPGFGLHNSSSVERQPLDICQDWWPFGGPYLRLFADACGTLIGEPFCAGDGAGAACPCGNSSPPLNLEGCRNSVHSMNGGRLETLGVASLAADTVLLRALRLPATTTTLFFQGDQEVAGGAGQAFGDGLRCAGGNTRRIGTKLSSNGQVENPAPGDVPISVRGNVTAPGRRYYQGWYRNSADFCTSATFNLTNGWRLDWGA